MNLSDTATVRVGMFCLWGFVLSQSVRDVYLGELFGSLGLYEIALLAFGTAALVFGANLLAFRRQELGLMMSKWYYVVALNLTTMVSWLCYFRALSLIEPAAVNLAFCGVAPAAVLIFRMFGFTSQGEHMTGSVERMLHFALLGTVLALFFVVWVGASGAGQVGLLTALAGVGLAALSGFSITAETIFAKRMNLMGVSPSAIVGVRFLMVAGISATMLLAGEGAYAEMSAMEISGQALIFLVIIIAPIYLVQAGVALTTPLTTGVICSLGPVATLILQSAVGAVELSQAMIIVIGTYTVIALAAAGYSARANTLTVTASQGDMA